jgi:hypothetical protein
MAVTLTGDGPHTLYLVADSGTLIPETSETNNTGAVTLQVGGVQVLADLAVSPMDITVTPGRPQAGETVQIAATFRNQGIDPANNFTVELYDGAPEAGGALIAGQTLSLSPGAEQTMNASWTVSSGIHDLYVVLDRMNGIVEADENNNRASLRVMTDMVDVTLSATDLEFIPAHPVVDDSVIFNVTVRNSGIKNTGPFTLALYDGDPNSGGALVQTYAVDGLPGDGSTILQHTFTAAPQVYRFHAIADTENVVAEMYEENNQAVRSLKIKAPGEILGPDLVPVKIDLSGMTTDTQTLAVSGNALVTFQNKGDDKITAQFGVQMFEDSDLDKVFTPDIDRTLETGSYTIGSLSDDQQPAIAIVVHAYDPPAYPGERVFLLEPDGKIAWGPVYLSDIDPEDNTAPLSDSTPVITDSDADGEKEIVIRRKKGEDIVLDGEGHGKQEKRRSKERSP